MFQGFLNAIVEKFDMTQPDAGATADQRKNQSQKDAHDIATLIVITQTIPFINKVLTQIKRDLPSRFTPEGFQEALAAIPEHNTVERERLTKEYNDFQNKHHYELHFLRYLCRYLNSIDHAHIISFMDAKSADSYLYEIKSLFDKLDEEKQQLVVPPLPRLSAKATESVRQINAEQHKKTVHLFYGNEGYLDVMTPAAIDLRLKQAIAKQITAKCAPAETAAKAKTDEQVIAAVVELLPMTDSNAVSTEFRDLIERSWFARPIVQETNWLTSIKGEVFHSAHAASAYLVEKLSQPKIEPDSYFMLS